ncbi:MAG TPA: recombination-associated protein RdgC [Kiritimatiellia bacterium]|nr:recombination-associated protein RdgC [Kiritimatiellia bacterium]HMO98082.1 recombination-associated protein RdgC [Kiritimatiellia bacterium]HMP97357.1 recombination-associated protein RdgC [Kiritimatiellia bacterium]
MPFESGSVSYRMFYVTKAMPPDAVARFAENAAPPLNTLSDGEIHGWVSGRHLLDRVLTDHNAYYAGFLRLTLMKAERKIPESLLRAECKMEELARAEAQGKAFLNRSERKEIKDEIIARLLPQMPPQLKGIPFVFDERDGLIYAAALNEKQMDAFTIYFSRTLGFNLIPVFPDTAAAKRQRVNVKEWAPTSFSPEVDDGEAGQDPGEDFLTWLWFYSEARGGIAKLDDLGEWAVMIDGPLHFILEGNGAHEAVLRRGEPRLSAEAKTSLLGGKKLKQAKLTLAQGDQSWSCTFTASGFVVRGLQLPPLEKMDAVTAFQERINMIGRFSEALLRLYDRFVLERNNVKEWKACAEEIRAWVSERKTRS